MCIPSPMRRCATVRRRCCSRSCPPFWRTSPLRAAVTKSGWPGRRRPAGKRAASKDRMTNPTDPVSTQDPTLVQLSVKRSPDVSGQVGHPYRAFLERVEKPARYLGGEYLQVKKPADEVAVRMVLAFPDIYDIGMSHLG